MSIRFLARVACLVVACVGGFAAPAQAASSVTIFGDLQSELGCSGDYDPACAAAHLTYDATDGLWQGSFMVPAGSWSYVAAVDDSVANLYGAQAASGGAALTFTLGAPTTVTFFYDPVTHWITSSRNAAIATAAGDFQSELGCPGDWQPDCLRTMLQDIDGDGIFTFTTSAIPPGSYEWKVAIDQGWSENYGAGGASGGTQLPFTVATGDQVAFAWNSSTHVPSVTVTPPTPAVTPTPAATPTPSPSPTPTPAPAPSPAPTPSPGPIVEGGPGGPLVTGYAATILTKTTADLLRHGLAVRLSATNAAAVTWRLGAGDRGTTLARGQFRVKTGSSTRTLKLTAGTKRRIRRSHIKRFKLQLSWVDSSGATAKLDVRATLKAK